LFCFRKKEMHNTARCPIHVIIMLSASPISRNILTAYQWRECFRPHQQPTPTSPNRCHTAKRQKHTTGGIPRWSPTLVLVARFSAYVWQSGRDAQFSLTYGRMYHYIQSCVTRHFEQIQCIVEEPGERRARGQVESSAERKDGVGDFRDESEEARMI
jgi:hypothetical protein